MTIMYAAAALAIVVALAARVHVWASATCYSQGTITASGRHVFVGEVAQNTLRFGTWITLDRQVFGRRHFVVLDRIGHGSELDFYYPSESACVQFGRRRVGYTVGWHR
jgi:3D (Asp-Asp-Asp) domain-containing protein